MSLFSSWLRDRLNQLLSRKGYQLLRTYELDYLKQKNREMCQEISVYFTGQVFPDLPQNSQRQSLLTQLYGTTVSKAYYILHYLHLSLKLSGDVCEMGIANGATSALLANELLKTKKQLFLFDSFQGLSQPSKKDHLINDIFHLGSMEKYAGSMHYSVNEVTARFNKIHFPTGRTNIIPGFIDQSIHSTQVPTKVCFAYIDFDLYEPIKVGLTFLNAHLALNGFIVVDDYGYFSTGPKTAVDEFIKVSSSNFKLILPSKFAGPFCILQKVREK